MLCKTTRLLTSLYALCSLAMGSSALHADLAPVAVSQGDYKPSAGASVHWEINESHTLQWGDQPYIPAGGVFQPRYLASAKAATDANWTADVQDLRTLKAHGVTQLILMTGGTSPGVTPITAIPPQALQRVLAYLDQNGFTYGLDLNAFPASKLQAVTVNPAIYRQPAPAAGSVAIVKAVEGLVAGSYFIVSTRDKSVLTHGAIRASGTDALVSTGVSGGDDTVLLVYPTRNFGDATVEGRHCPDFWSNADQVRDDLLLYFSKIKLGSGFRFFVDPLRDDLGYYGATGAGFLPTSAAYRRQFETWLNARYAGRLTTLETAWAVKDEDLPDIAAAARAIPLWYQSKGIESLYDPQADKTFDVDTAKSAAWIDIHAFQHDSMQVAMNGLADALKKGVADVPVVYRWSQASSVTLNQSPNGFDGLLVDSPLHGDLLAGQAAGYAVSDAEHARRTQWLLCELTPPAPAQTATGAAGKALVGYGSADRLAGDARILTQVGVRGIYVDALRQNQPGGTNLLDAPSEQLDWIHVESADFSLDSSTLSEQHPDILYYPADLALPGAQAQQLASGTWWLPATFAGKQLDLGTKLEGYSMPEAGGGQAFVIYSVTHKPEQIKLHFPAKQTPTVRTASGQTLLAATKGGNVTLTVTPEPMIVTGVTSIPLPEGALANQLAEVNRLIALGKDAGAPTEPYSNQLYYIQNNPLLQRPDGTDLEYGMLRALAAQLRQFVSPYIWIEGENPIAQSFGAYVASSDTSGGAYLWLDNPNPPVSGAYFAQYAFHVNAPADYDVWASLAPFGESAGSGADLTGLTVTVDSGAALNASHPVPSGDPYGSLAHSGSRVAGQFVWLRLSSAHLTPGDHTLTLALANPSKATARWTLGVDAICLSRGDFQPDGPRQPSF